MPIPITTDEAQEIFVNDLMERARKLREHDAEVSSCKGSYADMLSLAAADILDLRAKVCGLKLICGEAAGALSLPKDANPSLHDAAIQSLLRASR